jgi:hypothetical protein
MANGVGFNYKFLSIIATSCLLLSITIKSEAMQLNGISNNILFENKNCKTIIENCSDNQNINDLNQDVEENHIYEEDLGYESDSFEEYSGEINEYDDYDDEFDEYEENKKDNATEINKSTDDEDQIHDEKKDIINQLDESSENNQIDNNKEASANVVDNTPETIDELAKEKSDSKSEEINEYDDYDDEFDEYEENKKDNATEINKSADDEDQIHDKNDEKKDVINQLDEVIEESNGIDIFNSSWNEFSSCSDNNGHASYNESSCNDFQMIGSDASADSDLLSDIGIGIVTEPDDQLYLDSKSGDNRKLELTLYNNDVVWKLADEASPETFYESSYEPSIYSPHMSFLCPDYKSQKSSYTSNVIFMNEFPQETYAETKKERDTLSLCWSSLKLEELIREGLKLSAANKSSTRKNVISRRSLKRTLTARSRLSSRGIIASTLQQKPEWNSNVIIDRNTLYSKNNEKFSNKPELIAKIYGLKQPTSSRLRKSNVHNQSRQAKHTNK